ncbi:MAG: acyl-CoA dehydrogenase [Polyangiaceae bacterium UTPRO1]|jgi:alkylation response protein AidB-like acyl-CoA dehydrogenase|nr:acyl-CoA dehydrogenase family protein [Myxococcales bacterium]OQY68304.1 MAG: acyl-CoA dehydrogenase [Polyangiaceae bacterium UTPRO1]
MTEHDEFREYCRRWLAENRPAPPSFRLPLSPIEVMTEEQRRYLCAWEKKCYDAGLIGCDYPKEYGGGGHSGFQQIASQEMGRAQVPYMINVIGLSMAAPTILNHGTEEQKRRFIAPLLSADEIWCQGFSEPNAGSDLANAQASAVRDGDNWVINGHKVWTSLAHFASWMIMVTRTSNDHKYNGLTYFIVPIANTKGVTVRPLIKITGETGFNEVLFEDVVVPDSYRVDDIGKGWTVAMTTLLYERGAAEGAGSGGGISLDERVAQLIDLAKRCRRDGKPAWDDPIIRDRVAGLAIRVEGMRQVHRRSRVEALTDHPMRLPLQAKVTVSELMQDIAAAALEIEGPASSLYVGDPGAPDNGQWPLAYLNSYGFTIAAGSNEIQRNILGERVLGLAKSK